MDPKGGAYVAQNLKAWEEVAPIHARHNQERLKAAFGDPAYLALDDIAISRLRALGIKGADILQICCNNGIEVLSAGRLGARRVVGIDGAAGFVAQAQDLAKAARIDASFHAANIYEPPSHLDGGFDIVMITIGVLSWMPDIDRFF